MGGGGSMKSTSTSFSGSGQPWAQGYAKQGVDETLDVYNANKPQLSQNVADINNMASRFGNLTGQAQGIGGAANDYFGDVMGGKYLNSNPYLADMADIIGRSITDRVNSQFTAGGRYGSGMHTDTLARALADAETGLYYGDYGAERDRMGQAAQGSVAADSARSQAITAAQAQELAARALATEAPYTGTNNLASSLGQLFGGGTDTSTSKTKGPGLLSQALTAGATVAAAASDPRAKEGVFKIGEEPDGLGVYSFRYKAEVPNVEPGRHIGVMADEVAQLRPWALGPVQDGYMTVNYSKLEAA